jgi:hypothetical protein
MQGTFIRRLSLLFRFCSLATIYNLLLCVPAFAAHAVAQTEPASINVRVLAQTGAVDNTFAGALDSFNIRGFGTTDCDRVADLPRERFLGEPGDYSLQEHYGFG